MSENISIFDRIKYVKIQSTALKRILFELNFEESKVFLCIHALTAFSDGKIISSKEISKQSKIHIRNVQRSIFRLCELGIIEKITVNDNKTKFIRIVAQSAVDNDATTAQSAVECTAQSAVECTAQSAVGQAPKTASSALLERPYYSSTILNTISLSSLIKNYIQKGCDRSEIKKVSEDFSFLISDFGQENVEKVFKQKISVVKIPRMMPKFLRTELHTQLIHTQEAHTQSEQRTSTNDASAPLDISKTSKNAVYEVTGKGSSVNKLRFKIG